MQVFVSRPGGIFQAVQTSPEATVLDAVLEALDWPSTSARCDARVVCGGRTLDLRQSLAAAGVTPGSTLQLLPRLRGGGGDGGSTGAESRSCYLEMYLGKKPDKVNPEEERLARWTTCQLSGMALAPPCVADELGNLFNKDAVLQALVTKSVPKSLGHISSLKHVFDLKLHEDSGAEGRSKEAAAVGAGGAAQRAVRFSCPVTGLPMGGKGRFLAFRKIGHVVSERALKEVPAVVEELVGGKWAAEDLLPLNPPEEELEQMREALLVKREAARAAKRDKKKDKAAAGGADTGGNGATALAHAGSKRGAAVQATTGDASALYGGEMARNGPVANGGAAKKFKATELKPVGADEKVWNSIFTSSRGDGGVKNDFLVRGSTRMKTG